jgi:hypothetical protein
MNEKIADNRVIGNRIEIESLNNQISEEKNKLTRIEDVETEFIRIKNGIDKTASLLNQSIKGGNIKEVLGSVTTDSGKMVSSVLDNIDRDKKIIKNNIKKISDEKDELTNNN